MTQADPTLSAKLEALKAEVAATRPRPPAPPVVAAPDTRDQVSRGEPWWRWRRLAFLAGQVVAIVVLPFAVLVWTAVWAYRGIQLPTWLAIATAGTITAALITLYGVRVSKKLTGKHRLHFVATKVALPLIVVYCLYALLYLSSVNAKTPQVREYFTSVHPMLRLALSTAILADREIVVTDARRIPEDYARMGLPLYENSLHFRQEDGFVHAVDLRTVGRAEWKNALMIGYFKLMGFRTLRHVGTADHLHVSLPPR